MIVGLYLVAAVLPLAGLTGLLRESKRVVRRLSGSQDPRAVDTGQWLVTDTLRVWREATLGRPAAVKRDFLLIGGGVVLGCVASIWSLFV